MNLSQLKVTKCIVLFGVLAAVIAVVMTFILPMQTQLGTPMRQGFLTPIIAFELAQFSQDLAFITGNEASTSVLIAKFYHGLKWDMLFPFLYGSFILLLLIKALRLEKNKAITTKIGALFALIIPVTDIAENMAMLNILDAMSNEESITDSLLMCLHITTWLKWFCIAFSFGFLMLHFYRNKQLVQRKKWLPIAVCGLNFFSTLGAFLYKNPILAELMGFSVVLCIAYFLVTNSRELINYSKYI